ncbi:MAG: FtsX-like permease family protein, partial [Flavobacteriia bacterium]|nr:FtsX-like permease family protein [Flavobacteriia bacterium]
FDTNTWLLGVILTLVAAFNAAVVIFIRIIERRKSVAILRTMGLSSGRLMTSILTLFSRSILWGLLYGNLLAFSLLWAQDRFQFLPLDPQTYYVDAVPVAWNWVGFLLANLLIFIAVLLTSLVPAKILSKILPSQVLRMQ